MLSSVKNILQKTLLFWVFGATSFNWKLSTISLSPQGEKFSHQITFSNRCFSYFKQVFGAPIFRWCAVTNKRAPFRRIAKISMRHFEKRCAMAHMAHARIIPALITRASHIVIEFASMTFTFVRNIMFDTMATNNGYQCYLFIFIFATADYHCCVDWLTFPRVCCVFCVEC